MEMPAVWGGAVCAVCFLLVWYVAVAVYGVVALFVPPERTRARKS